MAKQNPATTMTVPLTATLFRLNGGTTTTEAEFRNGQYTCPAAKAANGMGQVWHLPPGLKVVYGQVRGRLAWVGHIKDISKQTWAEAWPNLVPPANVGAMLHVIRFAKVCPGSGQPSRVMGHRFC